MNDPHSCRGRIRELWVTESLHASRGLRMVRVWSTGAVEREVLRTALWHPTLVVQCEPQLVLQPEPVHELLERPGACGDVPRVRQPVLEMRVLAPGEPVRRNHR